MAKSEKNWVFAHDDASTNAAGRIQQIPGIDEWALGSEKASAIINNAIVYAAKCSTPRLIEDLNKRKELDYTTLGYLIELKRRKVPSISGPYRNVYKEVDGRIENNLRSMENWRHSLVETGILVGALLGNLGAGALMKKVVNTDSKEKVEEFAKKVIEDKKLSVNLEHLEDAMASHFGAVPGNPSEVKDVVRAGPDVAVAAHEFGHAENMAKYRQMFGKRGGEVFGNIIYASPNDYLYGRLGPLGSIPMLGLAVAPLASSKVTKLIKGKDTESTRYRVGTAIENHPGAIMAAAVSPKLYEEASASVRGIANMMKYAPEGQKAEVLREGIKKLGPAFLTYLTAAMIPYAAAHYAGATREDRKKQDAVLEGLKKAK